jgi:hypothetical protein
MSKPKLNIADKPAITAARRPAVELTVAGLKPFLKKSRWLGKSNRYATQSAKRVTSDYNGNNLHQRNLAQYVAASSTLHANDGWSYLSRSIASLLAGDAHRALHLAYYAELRAAMALLAATGVGIFNARHVVITTMNSVAKLHTKKGTHEIVWLGLEQWSRSSNSGALFARTISVEGLSLEDWFAPVGGASKLAPQARSWFLQWGMDLRFGLKDRESRNESSYRPDGVPQTFTLKADATLDYVRELWRVLEPRGPSSFEQIDRHILRLALESHFRSVEGKDPSSSDPKFRTLVQSTIGTQSLPTQTAGRLEKFLLRQVEPLDSAVFQFSAERPGSKTDPFSILSRAALLLRAATGSCRDLLTNAGLDTATLAFWWKEIGELRGLWEPGNEPDELTDLWADIRDFVIDAGEVPPPQSFGELARTMAGSLHLTSSCERVAVWGLCPA